MQVSKFPEQSFVPQTNAAPTKPRSWGKKIFLVLVIFFFLGGILLAVAAAKSGLVRIPVFSSLVSTSATPSHKVAVSAGTENLLSSIQVQSGGALARYARTRREEDRVFTFLFTEAMLTKSVQEAIGDAEARFPGVKILETQISAQNEMLELYLNLLKDGREYSLLVGVSVGIENEKPKIIFRKIQIGTLRLPVSIFDKVIASALKEQEQKFAEGLKSFAVLTDVAIQSGTVEVQGRLSSGVLSGR